MAEATLMIEKAVGEAAWDPSQQKQVEVNETLGLHPTRPTGRVGAVTLHELGVDPDGRSGFAIRAVRVDLPEQRPFGGQNTEFVFGQDEMDAMIGGYNAEDGIWCGLNPELEPLAFATWVRAMLDRRGFDVRSFGDFHVHARSKDVGQGYVSWVYQISLRGMAPTEALWQTMWHYEPHPDGALCSPVNIEREVSEQDESELLDGLDVSEAWVQDSFALEGLDHEDEDVWESAAQDELDFEDEDGAFEAYAMEGLEATDEDDVWEAIAKDGLDYIDFDAIAQSQAGDEDDDVLRGLDYDGDDADHDEREI